MSGVGTASIGGTGNLGMGVVFSLIDDFSANATRIRQQMGMLDTATTAAVASITAGLNKMKMGFMALGVAALLLIPMGMATHEAMKFEAVMSRVLAYTSATNVQMDGMRKQALALSLVTKFNATEIAEAQANMGGLGMRVTEIMSSLPSVLAFATAAQIETAQATELSVNAMHMFGMTVADIPHIVDVMAKTMTNSHVSAENLADSMKYLGSVAHILRIPIEEAYAAIGILKLNGISGSMATAALSTSLEELAANAQSLKQQAAIGISFKDAKGNFVGLANMLDILGAKLKEHSTMEQTAITAKIFNGRAAKEVLTLLQGQFRVMENGTLVTYHGAEALRKYTDMLRESGGAAEAMARIVMDNLNGDIVIMNSSIKTLGVSLGEMNQGPLRWVVQTFTEFVNLLSRAVQSQYGEWIVAAAEITGLLIAALGIFLVVGGLVSFLTGSLATSFAALGMTEIATTFATDGLIAGFKALAVSMSGLIAEFAPILIVAGMLLFLKKCYDDFILVFNGEAPAATGFLGLMQRIGGVIKGVIDIFASWDGHKFSLTEKMAKTLENMGILDTVIAIGTWIVRIKELAKGVFTIFEDVIDLAKLAFRIIAWVVNFLADCLIKLGVHINKTKTQLEGWTVAGKVLGIIIAYYVVTALWSMVVALWNVAAAGIAAFWEVIVVVAVVAAAIAVLYWIIKGVWWLFQEIGKGAVFVWHGAGKSVDYLADRMIAFGIGARKAFNWVLEGAKGIVDYITGIPEKLYDIGARIVNRMRDGIQGAWEGFKNWFMGLVSMLNPANWFHSADAPVTRSGGSVSGQNVARDRIMPAFARNEAQTRSGNSYTTNIYPSSGGGAGSGLQLQPVHVHVYADGEKIAEHVMDRMALDGSRR